MSSSAMRSARSSAEYIEDLSGNLIDLCVGPAFLPRFDRVGYSLGLPHAMYRNTFSEPRG
jgi:hypothetical protein